MKRLVFATAVLVAIVAITAVAVRGGLTTSSARADSPGSRLTPPPNVSDRLGTSGRWPATVTCGTPAAPPPCTTVLNPAILPGENTIAFFDGWFHGSTEPTGSYVFRLTLHGTLNGAPVDVTASSKAI